MRVDLHCHTLVSPDSLNTLDGLLRQMDRRHIDMVAITDHNEVSAAIEFARCAPGRFVIGEEIKTAQGELLALFVQERVPPGLSPSETIERIRDQGGLVGVSHPLDRARSDAVGCRVLEEIREQLDFIEVLNARTVFSVDNRLAHEKAVRWGLPGSAGSDAHVAYEVGRVYVEIPVFEGPREFIDCLAQGQIGGRVSSPFVHFTSSYARWLKRARGRRR
jgi:hypothetical protein